MVCVMFLEVVHINGRYDPAAEQHRPPSGVSDILPDVQQAAEATIALGGDVLYRMNLNGNLFAVGQNPGRLAVAVAADPFLSGLSEAAREKAIVLPDGIGPATTAHETSDPIGIKYARTREEWLFENLQAKIAAEDEQARRHGLGFVLGVFTTGCVMVAATEIKRRNPGARICVDDFLSVDVPGRQIAPGTTGDVALRSVADYLSSSKTQ